MKNHIKTKPKYFFLSAMALATICGFAFILDKHDFSWLEKLDIVNVTLGFASFAVAFSLAVKDKTERMAFLTSAAYLGFAAICLLVTIKGTNGVDFLFHHWTYFPIYEHPMDITLESLALSSVFGLGVGLLLTGYIRLAAYLWNTCEKMQPVF